MVRRGASLDANQAWWQLLEERQDVAAFELTADDHIAFRVNAVDLKNRLCDVETIILLKGVERQPDHRCSGYQRFDGLPGAQAMGGRGP